MKNKKVIAAILSLLITTQPAFAAGAIYRAEPECRTSRVPICDDTPIVANIFANYPTESEATSAALSDCRSSRGDTSECSIAATFAHGQCGAYVFAIGQVGSSESNPGRRGEVFIGTGASQSTAEQTAIAACASGADGGASTCRGAVSICDDYTASSSPSTPNITFDDPSDDDWILYAAGGAVVLGLLLAASSGYAEDAWTFTPRYDISNESGFSANAGGRWDLHKDEWHLYFSGDGSTNGKFNYQSGGSYTADFWTAEFSESVSGKTADYDLSLSSNFGGGIWKLLPTYRLHSEYSDSEFDTQNSLNLESEFRYNNWEIRPTAGFNWREFGEFADSGTFRINAVHHF